MSDLTFSNRSIVDFKQKLTGGGARSNLFEVEIDTQKTLALPQEQKGQKNLVNS